MTDIAIIVNKSGVVEIRTAEIGDTEFVRDIHAAISKFDAAIRRATKAERTAQASPRR